MNENILFNMDVKSTSPFHMRMIFEMYSMKMGAKVLRLNYNNVNINNIDMRSEEIHDMYRLILFSFFKILLNHHQGNPPFFLTKYRF